jgi:uncharacterized membrane protein YqjE
METSPKPAAESQPVAEGFFGAIAGAFASVRQVIGNFVELLTSEARRAGLTLMWMVALGAMAAILFVAAWLCLLAAVTLWLVARGMTWEGAIALVALVNLLAAAVVAFCCVMLSRNLLFPATRRQLRARSSSSDAA